MRFLILWFALLPSLLFAQIDNELRKQLEMLRGSKPDTLRIDLLHDVGKLYVLRAAKNKADLDSAAFYFKEAIRLTNSLSLKPARARSFRNENMCRLGEVYFQKEDTIGANDCFQSVINDYRQIGDVGREARTWLRFARHSPTIRTAAVVSRYQKAIMLYNSIDERRKEADAILSLSIYHLEHGNLEDARVSLLHGINICNSIGDRGEMYIAFLHYYGLHEKYVGDYESAISYALKSIHLKDSLSGNSTYGMGGFYNAIAALYRETGEEKKSIEWYRKAAAAWMNQKEYELYKFQSYISTCEFIVEMIKIGQKSEALSEIQNLIQSYPPQLDLEKAYAAKALGLCYAALNKYDLAEKQLVEMISTFEKADFLSMKPHRSEFLTEAYYDIGKFYMDFNKLEKAKYYVQKLRQPPRGLFTLIQHRDMLRMLYKIDSAAGDYPLALQNLLAQQVLNDSIFNVSKSKQIEELKIKYETERKENDLKLLGNENDLQQSRLELTIGGIFLLVIILTFVYIRYRTNKTLNDKLKSQQTEISKKNVALEALINDKEWLLKEIHHRVKNNLQMVISLLDTQSDYLKDDLALVAIRESKHRMHAISLIHQKLYQTESVSQINMPVYINELVDYLRDSLHTGYRIDFRTSLDPVMLSVSFAVPIGLILNEAITNSVKYAFPENTECRITVSLQNHLNILVLRIKDNGIGLPLDFDNAKQHSFGMNLMAMLSEQVEGNLTIATEHGTLITLTIPLPDHFQNEIMIV